MKAIQVLRGLLLLAGCASMWMVWLTWGEPEQNPWMFIAFAAAFLIPFGASFFTTRARPDDEEGTHFAPHRALLLGLLAMLGVAILALVALIRLVISTF